MYNVVFDMGGVVLDWNPGAVLHAFYADPVQRAHLQDALFDHPDWLELDRGTLLEDEALVRLEQRTGRPRDELVRLFAAIKESLEPKHDTLALIASLKLRGVPLYVLSNMATDTYQHLRERHDWWQLFRGIVISGQIRLLKPDREIFEHLLSEHGLEARQTIFVDDNRPNLEAAAALGIKTVWFRDARQCEAELEALMDESPGASG